jgi:lipopolysaccharide export system protein LptA
VVEEAVRVGERRRASLGRALACALGALGLASSLAADAGAQERCEWLAPSGTFRTRSFGATTLVSVMTPHLQCADGIRLRADSARHYEGQNYYQLFGNAYFESTDRVVQGQLIRYWRNEGRVEIRGDGRVVRKSDNSVVTGDEIDLLQAGEQREQDRLTVRGGRPRAVFTPEGAAAGDSVAGRWDVQADRLFFWGEESLTASGEVEVHRDSLDAYARSFEFDRLSDRLSLRGDARMVTGRYDLEGDSITALVVDDEIRSLTALGDALLTGEDLRLAAARIFLDMPSGAVERLVAVRDRTPPSAPPGLEQDVTGPAAPDTVSIFDMAHPPRPVAHAEGFLMVADSLDIRAPGEVLRRLIALGSARGESTSRDSLNTEDTPDIARRDWIEGDTVIATFVPVEDTVTGGAGGPAGPAAASPDSARDAYRLEELVARVNARTLYRMAPADSTEARDPAGEHVRLALHYVTGNEITITLDEGEVRLMEVVGLTEGLHLEPVGGRLVEADTAVTDTAAADTAAAAGTPPDTAGAAVSPGPPGRGPAAPRPGGGSRIADSPAAEGRWGGGA